MLIRKMKQHSQERLFTLQEYYLVSSGEEISPRNRRFELMTSAMKDKIELIVHYGRHRYSFAHREINLPRLHLRPFGIHQINNWP